MITLDSVFLACDESQHQGRAGMAEKSCSPHGSQEAEKKGKSQRQSQSQGGATDHIHPSKL